MTVTENKTEMSFKGRIAAAVRFFAPALLTLFLFGVVLNISVVRGNSMNPTFQDKAVILTQRLFYAPKHGDVIVFHVPNAAPDTIFIKRVIGVAGDEIDIDFERGCVYVNGQLQDEPYIAEPTTNDLGETYPLTVKENCVFVLGDNRNNSLDSRSPSIGQIPVENIIGGYLCTLKK